MLRKVNIIHSYINKCQRKPKGRDNQEWIIQRHWQYWAFYIFLLVLLNGVNKILVEVMMFCQFCTRSKDQHNGFFLSHFNSANSLKQQYTRQERHFALLGHIILISCHLDFQRFNALKRRAHYTIIPLHWYCSNLYTKQYK